jgi:hypothetical protein
MEHNENIINPKTQQMVNHILKTWKGVILTNVDVDVDVVGTQAEKRYIETEADVQQWKLNAIYKHVHGNKTPLVVVDRHSILKAAAKDKVDKAMLNKMIIIERR